METVIVRKCDQCGRAKITTLVTFKQNVSYFFQRQQREFSGWVCFGCMTLQFVKFEFVTLIGTWWGMIGCLLGPVFILSNLDEYISGGFFIVRHTVRLRLRGAPPTQPPKSPADLLATKRNWRGLLGAFLIASALAATAVGIPTYGWLGILPVLGMIIAACGVWIAWQQKRIADVHLRHEQYDRKCRVYGSAKGLLVGLQADGRITRSSFQRYIEGVADAEFLFDQNVQKYLNNLRKMAARNIHIGEQLRNQDMSQEQRNVLIDEELKSLKWFLAQFDEIRDLFRSTMQL